MNAIPFFIMYFFVYETLIFDNVTSYRVLFKFLSSMCFLLCSILSYKKSPTTKKYSILIICGLLFGLIGDVFLTLPINNSFICGAASFAIGNILFIIGFSSLFPIHIKDFFISILGCASFTFFITHNSSFNLEDKLPITCVYSFIIIFMLVKSCYLFKLRKLNSFFAYFTIAGSFIFAISDFILTFKIFLINAPAYLNALNLVVYYSGQGLVALSLSDTDLNSSQSCNNIRNN